MNVTRLAWLLFILIVVALIFGAVAMAQSSIVCSEGYCTMREDSMIALLRYLKYLESLVSKTCI